MVTHLRPYQRLALYHLQRNLEAGAWRQYLDLPTGTGKSTIAAVFAARRQTQVRILALVHRQDLALQLAETLSQEELEVGLLMEGSHTLHTPVVVATVQSLTPEATQDLVSANSMPILTVLIDEAHHAVPGSVYERVLDAVEQAASGQSVSIVGLTATPYRNDERSMLSLLPVCAFARTIPEMVQEGYLAPLNWKPVQVDLDLAEVATTHQAGERDYAETTLARKLLRETITARLVEHTAALIEHRPTLLDPLGRSPYRWTTYSRGYFARINAHVTAILERDPAQSGLYRSRQYAREPEQTPEHQWIERHYLPSRQQVALVEKATGTLFREAFGGKEAAWLDELATQKQLETLGHYQQHLPEQARAAGWTKREAHVMTLECELKRKTSLRNLLFCSGPIDSRLGKRK